MRPERELRNLGPVHRREKGGDELVFSCPKCGHRKFYVNHKKEAAHCFSCTWSTRSFRWLRRIVRSMAPEKRIEDDKPIEVQQLMSLYLSPFPGLLLRRGLGHLHQSTFSGWGIRPSDGRLLIPVIENGEWMCWVARSMDGREPKELSGPNRSHFFYGYDQVVSNSNVYSQHAHASIVLVEGIFDQIRLASYGAHCLALMGSSLSDIQIGKLLALRPGKIFVMMDGDEAGRKANDTIADKLSKRMNPMNVHQIWLPDGKDPDELTREEFHDLLGNR